MRSILLSLLALIGVNLWAQTTDVQFQAHVPFTTTEVSFSAYIADSSFDEGSRLNSKALWFIENKVTPVSNSMINVLLQNIPDSIFTQNWGKIYVYSYVNGQSMGKLPFYKLPYALHANHAELAGRSTVSNFAQDSKFAERADTANYATNSGRSVNADTAMFSWNTQRSRTADSVDTNGVYTHSIQNGAVTVTKIANGSVVSEKLSDNSVENRHVADNAITLDNIAGNSTAAVGSYLTKGANGINWSVNPHHNTSSVMIYTQAPPFLYSNSRWIVSRVAVDYNLATVENPTVGQLVTIYNGSTANVVTLKSGTWSIDTGLDLLIPAGRSSTLWYSGFSWVVIQ